MSMLRQRLQSMSVFAVFNTICMQSPERSAFMCVSLGLLFEWNGKYNGIKWWCRRKESEPGRLFVNFCIFDSCQSRINIGPPKMDRNASVFNHRAKYCELKYKHSMLFQCVIFHLGSKDWISIFGLCQVPRFESYKYLCRQLFGCFIPSGSSTEVTPLRKASISSTGETSFILSAVTKGSCAASAFVRGLGMCSGRTKHTPSQEIEPARSYIILHCRWSTSFSR